MMRIILLCCKIIVLSLFESLLSCDEASGSQNSVTMYMWLNVKLVFMIVQRSYVVFILLISVNKKTSGV